MPRGNDIVTRCPLFLQLKHCPDEEYAKFEHIERKLTNFDEVKAEIEKETDNKTGKTKTISDTPINLEIVSPHGNFLMVPKSTVDHMKI